MRGQRGEGRQGLPRLCVACLLLGCLLGCSLACLVDCLSAFLLACFLASMPSSLACLRARHVIFLVLCLVSCVFDLLCAFSYRTVFLLLPCFVLVRPTVLILFPPPAIECAYLRTSGASTAAAASHDGHGADTFMFMFIPCLPILPLLKQTYIHTSGRTAVRLYGFTFSTAEHDSLQGFTQAAVRLPRGRHGRGCRHQRRKTRLTLVALLN